MYMTESYMVFSNFCLKPLYSEFPSTKVQRLLKTAKNLSVIREITDLRIKVLGRGGRELQVLCFESNYSTSSKGIAGNG